VASSIARFTRSVIAGLDYNAYITPLPARGAAACPSLHQAAEQDTDLQQISDSGALYPRWLSDGTVLYGWTNLLFRYRLWRPTRRASGEGSR